MAATVASPPGRIAFPPPKCPCSLLQSAGVSPAPQGFQKSFIAWPRCSLLNEGCLDLSTDQGLSSFVGRHVPHLQSASFLRPAVPREQRPSCRPVTSAPMAFLEDDQPYPATVTQRDMAELGLRAQLEAKYGSQFGSGTISMFGRHNLLQRRHNLKEGFGGTPPGGGKNNGRGRGDGGGGGGGGGEGQTAIYLLPVLTLVFAAVFLGYAVAVGLKEEGMNMDFLRTSAGLFGLLALAAFRVNNQTGIDAFILGLGASTAVMVWTGERFVVRKEIAPAGIVTFLAASMAVIFTGALYHSL